MKSLTRRHLLQNAGLMIAGMAASGFALRPGSRHVVVQAQSVSAFSAPLIVEQLKAKRPLDVFWKRGKAWLALDEYLLGWLPDPSVHAWKQAMLQGRRPAVRVERTGRNLEGRLLLFVKIMLEEK
jgi:hypothetical protein